MKALLASPIARLVGRAAIAGLAAGVAVLQTSATIDRAALSAASTAALLAAVEYFTPLNQLVGVSSPSNEELY